MKTKDKMEPPTGDKHAICCSKLRLVLQKVVFQPFRLSAKATSSVN